MLSWSQIKQTKNCSGFLLIQSIGLQWTSESFKKLGTWFSLNPDEVVRLNTMAKLNQITAILRSWQAKKLSLKGKITVLKSLVSPHTLQLASTIVLSDKVIGEIEGQLSNFVWSNRKHLVNRATLIKKTGQAGLKIPSVIHLVSFVK